VNLNFKPAREVVAAFSTRPMNVIGNVSSIVGLVLALLAEFRWDASAILLSYLCGLSLYLMLRYVRQERWARYAEGVRVMDRAMGRVKEVTDRRLFGSLAQEDAISALQESVESFAEAFTLVTGTNCRASIKEVFWEETAATKPGRGTLEMAKELWVATLVRSDIDESRRVSEEEPDRVSENSDFNFVVTSVKPFYGSDLPKAWDAGKYQNSHWDDELRQSRDFKYRSAIVWPIGVDRPTDPRRRKDSENRDGDDPVIALLCIDSKRAHAFRPTTDIQFGSLYAHAVYPVLNFDRGSE
jgi:hypothetical protein